MVFNYENKLIEWASNKIGSSFKYGINDCVSLCRQGLEIIYGNDVLSELGNWNSKKEALDKYQKFGCPVSFIRNKGWNEIDKNYIQTGDILIMNTVPLKTCCIVIHDKVLVIDKKRGIILQQVSNIKETVFCFRKGRIECHR